MLQYNVTGKREVLPKYSGNKIFLMNKSAGVALGILAFVIAGATVYGLFSLNSTIQGKPDQISNYSAQINSLEPKINSINNNMSSLGILKGDITDIRGKLSDLESKINQVQQTSVPEKPVILLGKSAYFPGDTAYIIVVGLAAQKVVQIQLVDTNGIVVKQQDVLTDSGGRVAYSMQLSSALVPGIFHIKLNTGQLVISQQVTIMQPSSGSVILSGMPLFTVQTDKTIYQTGDHIEVFGVGAPNTDITGILTSPSGRTLTSVTSVQPDGTYVMFITDSKPFETGNWYITVKNQGQERITYLAIQSDNSSPYTFTAQPYRAVYQAGDLIRVSGTGQPYTSVNAVLTSPSGLTFTVATTTSSDGTYLVSVLTSQYYERGNWYITLNNQGQTRQVSVFIGPVSSSSNPFTFTAQTDKDIYKKGDLIRVSGTGQPYTSVNAVLTSSSGKTYYGLATVNFDGSYGMSYSIMPSFETGVWHITLNNGVQEITVSIFVEPTS
jgi:hypothetical protein